MDYIKIDGVESSVSQLIIGSDYFSPEDMDQVSYVLNAYTERGGNTIDTALVYGGGKSEKAVGLWLQQQKSREKVNLFTKGAHHDSTGPRVRPECIEQDLQISLERLQTDRIELYGLHRDDPEVEVGPIMEALNKQMEEGLIHAFGASNWTSKRIQEANDYASTHGLRGFSFSSPNLSLAKPNEPFWADCVSADTADCQWHQQSQLPLLSWSSQARGFFSGRFTPENRDNADIVRVFYSEDNWERLRRAEELAKQKNATAIQIALAYVLNQPFPTCALIGPRNEAEMDSCFAATSIALSAEERQWLDLSQ